MNCNESSSISRIRSSRSSSSFGIAVVLPSVFAWRPPHFSNRLPPPPLPIIPVLLLQFQPHIRPYIQVHCHLIILHRSINHSSCSSSLPLDNPLAEEDLKPTPVNLLAGQWLKAEVIIIVIIIMIIIIIIIIIEIFMIIIIDHHHRNLYDHQYNCH